MSMSFVAPPGNNALGDLLDFWATHTPSSVALRCDGVGLTYAELQDRANLLAARLSTLGTGARVAVVSRNSPTHVELLFGAAKSGTVLVPLNWRLSLAELTEIIADAGIGLLVISEEFVSLVPALHQAGPSVPPVLLAGNISDSSHGLDSYATWARHGPRETPFLSPDPASVVLQIYTSGTTGRFKGVILTNSAMTAHLTELSSMLGYSATSVNLTAMPMFHMSGIGGILLGVANGSETVLLRDADVDLIAETIERQGITHAFLVPVVVAALLDRVPAIDWSSLETIIYGASVISVPLLKRALNTIGCSFVQIYGLTESRGASTYLPPDAHQPTRPELLRSCGKALPWVDIRVVDHESGQDVPQGGTGELWIKSPQNMLAYWNAPDATAEALVDGGWLRSGDAGHIDSEGWIFIDDRIKDMIISGGENIYPAEIERLLYGRPDVKDVAVVGVPSERWGETPAAFIVANPELAEPTRDEILQYCRTNIARYKCPTIVEFVPDLPRNSTGKIVKSQLSQPFWTSHSRPVN
jgi:long-chain acyl-CoA synthetase